MSERGPDFDKLVGPEVEASERERLRRVHDALLAAGPPPDLPASLSAPPAPVARLELHRRRLLVVALAAALGTLTFAVGVLVGQTGNPTVDRVVAMSGSSGATASLDVFEADDAGNWPMELRVEGLRPPPSGGLYQLWLTKNGKLAALCGSFLAEADGSTVVPMNAPWRLKDFDGWVVVEGGSTTPVLTT